MRFPPIFPALLALGRTGLPDIVISAIFLRFALVQHSAVLALFASLLLWPGLANLHHVLTSKKPPPEDK